MAWTIEFAAEAEQDFELIFDHFFGAYLDFGEPESEAYGKAAKRVTQIRDAAERIATTPYRGTLRENIQPHLRNVTIEQAIYWFEPDADTEVVRILAVFTDGQDHMTHMLVRLLDLPDDI